MEMISLARKFEKISWKQFQKDINKDKKLYQEYFLPKRETKYAAGYDFYALYDEILKPGEIKKIPTGVKVQMEDDDCLLLFVRSGMGFKYNVRLCNQVGLIDKDYYDNPDNEGHIWIRMQNEGNKDYIIKKGDGIVQGLFVKYLLTEDDVSTNKIRTTDK